jgi:hypothetical protein
LRILADSVNLKKTERWIAEGAPMPRANSCIKSLETALDLAVWLEKHVQAFYERAAVTADAD